MNTLLILFAQTKTGASLEILSLLLVSAIIGFVTAWLYNKSVYERKMKTLEEEKVDLTSENNKLKADRKDNNKIIHEREMEISQLDKEIKALKALHAKDIQETDAMILQNNLSEQLLYEKDEALLQIAQRKHLLDYNSFGTANIEERDDLKMISGIGPFIEERLHALDIFTFLQISRFTAKDISTINIAIEYFSGRIERDEWVEQAKELVHSKEKRAEFLERIRARKTRIYFDRIGIAQKNEADDLTVISGIGGWMQEKLNVLDIYTFKQISRFTDEDVELVTEAIEYFPGRIERDEWISQAKELVSIDGKKTDLLNRISEGKQKIYFDRLGVAHKHEANNLTLINGIGLWMEERLNMLGILTFNQISRFTKSDIEEIEGILEISPDRIIRDEWITQARELAKKEIEIKNRIVSKFSE